METPRCIVQSVFSVLLIHIFWWANLVLTTARCQRLPPSATPALWLFILLAADNRNLFKLHNGLSSRRKSHLSQVYGGRMSAETLSPLWTLWNIFSSFLFVWQDLEPLTGFLTGPGVIFSTIMFGGVWKLNHATGDLMTRNIHFNRSH